MDGVKVLVSVLAFSACLLATPAQADAPAAPHRFITYVFKANSCGDWAASAHNQATRNAYHGWISGYVSGINFAGAGPINDLPEDPTIDLYIDKFCRENPLSNFSDGVKALVRELLPKQ